MANELLAEQRSEIIEGAISIENYINHVICLHYFKNDRPAYLRGEGPGRLFLDEVLSDESFTFGLRLHVLMKIAPEFKKNNNALHRIGYIRNRFAHCQPLTLSVDDSGARRLVAVDPRSPQKTVEFDKLYAEFKDLHRDLEKEFSALLTSKGARIVPLDPPIK